MYEAEGFDGESIVFDGSTVLAMGSFMSLTVDEGSKAAVEALVAEVRAAGGA